MKKVLSRVLVFVLVLAMMSGSFANLSAYNVPMFVVSSATLHRGESADITISFRNNPGITSAKFKVQFDNSALTLNSVTYNIAELGGQSMHPARLTSPVVLNWINGLDDTVGDMVYATLNFTVAEDAQPGEKNIYLTYDQSDVFNYNYDLIDFAVENGKITVVEDDPQNPPVNTDPTFVVSSANLSPGETGDITISMKNNPGIASIKLYVQFDNSALTLNSIVYNKALGGQSMQPATMASPVTLNWLNKAANTEGDMVFATLNFTVKANATPGDELITVTYPEDDVYNISEYNVYFAVENGKITVGENVCTHANTEVRNAIVATCTQNGYTGDTYCLTCGAKIASGTAIAALGHNYRAVVTQPTYTDYGYTTYTCSRCGDSYVSNYTDPIQPDYIAGDINGDGKVNNKDLTRLFQYFTGWPVQVNELAFDINGDGKVNNKDVTRLFQYLYGWDVEIYSVPAPACYHIGGTETINAVKPTAGKAGYTGDTYCLACGELIASGTVVPASSAGNLPEFVVSQVNADAGDSVDVTIALKNNPGIASAKLTVQFDNSALTLNSVTYNAGLGGQSTQPATKQSPVILNWFNGSDNTGGDMVYATLNFTVSADAAAGDKTISVSYNPKDVYNINENDIYFATESGKITVKRNDPTFVISSEVAGKGGNANVTVALKNNPGITSLRCIIAYDSALTLNTITYNMAELGGQSMQPQTNKSPVILNWFNAVSDIEGDIVFATLNFTVSPDATLGDKPITLTYSGSDVFNVNYQEIEFAVENGKITVIDACTHTGGTEVRNAIAATCTQKGYTGDTYCLGCGAKIATGTDIAALGHNYTSVVTNPTCTHQGYTTHTCTRCGESYIDNYTDPLGHTGGTATCHSKAVCSRCGTEYGEFDPQNHDGGTEVRNALVATCSYPGYTGDTYCLGCGMRIAIGVYIEQLPHTPSDVYSFDSMCHWKECIVCGSVIEESKPHSFEWRIVSEPTLEREGFREEICHICGCKGDSYAIPKLILYESTVEGKKRGGKIVYDYTDPMPISVTAKFAARKLCAVKINGAEISSENYEVTEDDDGNVKIILKESYLETLAYGDYDIELIADDGIAQAKMKVVDPYAPQIDFVSGKAFIGKTVNVDIVFKNNPGITSAKIVLDFNSDLTLTDIKFNDDLGGIAQQPQNYNSPVILNWANGIKNLSGDLLYATLTFRISDTANEGETYIHVSYDPEDIFNLDEQNIDFDAIDGEINLIHCKHQNIVIRGMIYATCTQCGYTGDVYCVDCEEKLSDGEITDPLGHDYMAVVTVPTCTARGYTTYTCTRCGESYIDNYTDPLGHTGGTATCHSKAVCSRCGVEYGEFDPNNHDTDTEVRNKKSASCTETGYTGDTYCLGCGEKIKTGYVIPMIAHKVSDWIIDKKATLQETGLRHKECKTCGGIIESEVIPVVDPTAPRIEFSLPTFVPVGRTFTVDIAIKNNPGIASMKLEVEYDSDFTLTEIIYNDSIGGTSQQPQTNDSPVVLNWYNGAENTYGDFVFATLIFTVSEDATAGQRVITATYDPEDLFNIDETNIEFAVLDGETEVIPYLPGDINNDGKVNNKDLTRLFQYLSKWNVQVNEAALDVNGDGKSNNKDLTRLFQYLSKWNVQVF